MSQCSVHFFDKNLKLIHYDTVTYPIIDNDALVADKSDITIMPTDKIYKNCFIYFDAIPDFIGVVTDVDNYTDEELTQVSFQPIYALFNHNTLINTNDQGSVALEKVIADSIKRHWVSSSDSLQNIPVFNVTTTSSTTTWGMNLKSDTDGQHHAIVNLYSTLIQRALSKYGIALKITVNFKTKKINIAVGRSTKTRKIDADLPGVTIKTFKTHELNADVNKLEIWNTKGYSESIVYYLHTDGKYSTTNTKRIEPVLYDADSAEADPNDASKTFAKAAASVASSAFSGIDWTDSIELEVGSYDSLIDYKTLDVGQDVEIAHGDKIYKTIYTGYSINENVTLMFGTVRESYTKKQKLAKG